MRCKYAIATPTSSSESGRRAAACRKPLTRILSAAAAMWLFVGASQAAAEGITLQQCANGNIDDPVDHLECYEGWINGSANAQKAAFEENAFVPYRVHLTGLSVGETYTYSFSWDTMHQGLHGLDYIGTYDYSITNADLCQGLAGGLCLGTASTMPIPPDTDLPFAQTSGEFTMHGGTLSGVGPYTSPSADSRAISVTFVAGGTSAVLGWGGHLSSPMDWGDGTTASDINGSPYHVSNIALTDSSGTVVASGGQDVQLSAAAVYVPAAINVTKRSNKDGTFSFESFLGNEALPPDGEANPWTLNRDETKTLMAMKDGTVSISEISLPDGDWRIKSVTCSKLNAGEVFNYPNGSNSPTVSIDGDEGGTFNCVFENEFFGAPVAEVTKKVIGANESCTDAVRDSGGYESRNIRSGETVRYCYWVTNTGSDTLLDVMLTDDMGTTNDLLDDVTITLSGGGNVDGQFDAPDLVVGDYVSGELVVTHNIALGTTVTNIAEGEGYGETDQQAHGDTDTAAVIANVPSSCSLTATVSTDAGSCAGGPTVYALDGTEIFWCANVSWDGGAILDLTDITVSLDGQASVSASPGDMSPGAAMTLEIGSMLAGASDFTGTMRLKGLEGGLNLIECSGAATIDVVGPDLQLRKTVMAAGGTCGVDDATSIEVIYGDYVEYCMVVENTGDVELINLTLEDPMLETDGSGSLVANGVLAASGSLLYQSEPLMPTEDVVNTASAKAFEPLTQTPIDPEYSSALVTVLKADLSIDKSVNRNSIVICDPANTNLYCSEPNAQGLYDGLYTLVVTNNGPAEAEIVSVTDTLPEGVKVISLDPRCAQPEAFVVTCEVGPLSSGDSTTIEISVEMDPSAFEFPWGTFENTACVNTDPARMDPDPSNNCDSASTRLSTGPTHTIGYWGTHPEALEMCGAANGYTIDLGFLILQDDLGIEKTVDAMVSTVPGVKGKWKSNSMAAYLMSDQSPATEANNMGLTTFTVMAKGLLNADVASWTSGEKRSAIGQARTKTSRQLVAAWCNETLLGGVFSEHVLSWSKIRGILAGKAYLQDGVLVDCGGTYCADSKIREVIDSIIWLNNAADQFNNSGLDLDDGLPPMPANPAAPENDPTDPGVSVFTTATSLDSSTKKGKGSGRK